MAEPTISVVIVNHDSGGTILKVIQSVLEQGMQVAQIIIVDNASRQDDLNVVRQTFPMVEIIQLEKDHGLAVARNAGLKISKGDLVLILDDDIYLSKDSLQRMVKTVYETKAVVVCPRIVLYPQNETIHFDGASIHFIGTLILNHSFQPITAYQPKVGERTGFGGACLLMWKDVIAETGYFNEDYPFYFEDLELSYRMNACGYKIYCEERAVVFHDRDESRENLSLWGAGSYPTRRAFYTIRNRWLTIAIHYQARTLLLLLPALVLYELAAFLETLRRGWLREYVRAVYSLMQIAGRILRQRQSQQIRRKVNDGRILTGGDLPFSRGFVENKTAGLVRALNWMLNTYWETVKSWL